MTLQRDGGRFQILSEHAPFGIIMIDEHDNFTYLNPCFKKLFGYELQEIPNGREWLLKAFPDYYYRHEVISSWFNNVKNTGPGEKTMGDLSIKCKNGSTKYVYVTSVVLQDNSMDDDKYLTFFEDLTARKKVEKALKESNRKLKGLFNSASDAIFIHESGGHFLEINDIACKMLGYIKSTLLNMSFIDVSDPIYAKNTLQKINSVEQNGQLIFETAFKTCNNDTIPVEVNSRVIVYQGKKAFLSIARDIKERKNAETKLKKAMETIEIASHSKSEFLANMSHEIRTPMNAIIGMTELVLDSELTNDQRDNLETVLESGNYLLGLINDILDLSKIEAGKLEIEEFDFELRGFVDGLIKSLYTNARSKGLGLSCNIHPDIPLRIKSDQKCLAQIVNNIIGNAIKFTEKGRISVNIVKDSHDKNLLTYNDPIILNFSVSDTGIGIPEERLDAIFDIFTQADGSLTRKYGGTGLGLAISKKIVNLLGGKIWVESLLGKGSTFYFSIPVKIGREYTKTLGDVFTGDQLKTINHESTQDSVLSGMSILLAEDNSINQKLILKILHKHGHKIVSVKNGYEVLDALKEQHFDMILMDIQMPLMDGIETTWRIRNSRDLVVNSDIPIIALTAHAMNGDRERFIAAGMNDYVSKPFHAMELIDMIEKHRKNGLYNNNGLQDLSKKHTLIDIEEALARMCGDVGLLKELWKTFIVEAPLKMANIKDALLSHDMACISNGAHILKSSSGIVGAKALKHKAGFIEVKLKEGNYHNVSAAVKDMEATLGQTVDIYLSYMNSDALINDNGRKPIRALIVEDDSVSRIMLQRILSRYGNCEVAANGDEAVRAFALSLKERYPYNLICMDIVMPEMNGHESLEKIREIERNNGIGNINEAKVIMITALEDPRNVVNAFYHGGAASYIVKPLDAQKLISELKGMGVVPIDT